MKTEYYDAHRRQEALAAKIQFWRGLIFGFSLGIILLLVCLFLLSRWPK